MGFVKLIVFISIFALLLQDYGIECRGRGGGGGARGGRYRGGGSSGGCGGGGPWWLYVAIFGGILVLVIGAFILVYFLKCCR